MAIKRFALARWRVKQDQPETARELYAQAVDLEPANLEWRLEYAALLAKLEDWGAAKQEAEKAFAGDATRSAMWIERTLEANPNGIAEHYLKALWLTFREQYWDARLVYEERLRAWLHNAQVAANLAAICVALADWDAAESYYRTALEAEPRNVGWLEEYADLLEKCGREREALNTLERVLAIDPDDAILQQRVREIQSRAERSVEALKRAALAKLKLEEEGETAEAEELVRQALAITPGCALAYRVYAEILKRQHLVSQAETQMLRALELEPDNVEFQSALRLLRAEVEPRKREVADLVARARVEQDPLASRSLLDRANELAETAEAHIAYVVLNLCDDPAEAEWHLRAALRIGPRHFEANRQYARWLVQQGRLREADEFFGTALTIEPRDEELVTQYAGCLIEQGRYSEARTRLDGALASHPESVLLQMYLLVVTARLGEASQALPQFEAFLQSDADNALVHREYAVALLREHQPERAEVYFQQALQLNPNDAITHREYAALRMARQMYHQANQHIQIAARLRPNDPSIVDLAEQVRLCIARFERAEPDLAYAVLLADQPGAQGSARQAFESALASDPTNWLILKEYATFLERQGDYARAEEMLMRGLSGMLANSEQARQFENQLEQVRSKRLVLVSLPSVAQVLPLQIPGMAQKPSEIIPPQTSDPARLPRQTPPEPRPAWWARIFKWRTRGD